MGNILPAKTLRSSYFTWGGGRGITEEDIAAKEY